MANFVFDTPEARRDYWRQAQLVPFLSNRAPFQESAARQMELAQLIEDCADYYGLHIAQMYASRTEDEWQITAMGFYDDRYIAHHFAGPASVVVSNMAGWAVETGVDRSATFSTKMAQRVRAGDRGLN